MSEQPGVMGEPVDLDRIADALDGAGERLHERNQHLGNIGEAVTALCLSTDALIIAVTANTQRNRNFRWTMLAITGLALVGIVAALLLVLRLDTVANENHGLNKAIVSCTVPTGKCYQDEGARTEAAVSVLENQTAADAAAAVFCSRTARTYPELLACVKATAVP